MFSEKPCICRVSKKKGNSENFRDPKIVKIKNSRHHKKKDSVLFVVTASIMDKPVSAEMNTKR